MDIRERQAMRRRKRRKQRQMLAMGAIAIVLLIAVLCFALPKGEKTAAPATPTPTPQTEATPEPTPTPTPKPQTAEEFVAAMSLDDKLMQMFILSADGFTGVANSTLYGGKTQKAVTDKPVGGLVYAAGNMENKQQIAAMISNTQKQYTEENGFPLFIIAEEEGGELSPVAGCIGGNVGNMSQFADGENFDGAAAAGIAIGKYMKSLGFNMNLAPNLRISDSPRSFGTDAETVSSMAMSMGEAMNTCGVLSIYKSFPEAVTSTTLAELSQKELLPFQMAAANGAAAMMVSAENVPLLTGANVPCYTSAVAVTDTLRTNLDFDGLIITAPLTGDETVTAAVIAGCDMLFMPKDLTQAVANLKGAIERGEITEERINQSVKRIINLKLSI